MARTVLPIVGAVVGAYFGQPALGYAIGAGIAGVVDPVNVKGPRIGDTGAQTSSEGAFRAIVYGTCQVTGNVIASGPLIKRDVKESQGKGGGTSSTEHAYRTYAVRVCEGPVAGYLRVWEDDKLVYDVRPESTMLAESAKWKENKVFYLGDEDQLPDPSLQMIFGVDETPAHRGSAYMVAIEDDLTDRRGSIKQYRFEAATSVTSTSLEQIDSFPASVHGFFSKNFGVPIAAQHLDTTLALPDARVCLLTVSASLLEPGSAVTTTFVVSYDGDKTYNGVLSGNQTVVIQLSTLNEPIRVVSDITASLVATGLSYSVSLLYPLPSEIDPDYVAYGGDQITADDPLYGVLDQPGIDLVAASWGPEYLVEAGGSTTLQAIVLGIHERCDFPLGKVDVSGLSDQVSGLVLAGDYTGGDAINTLRGLYLFDRAEYDKKIHYPKRGAAVVHTLTIDDLVEEPDTSKREQAVEFPKKLHLSYQNAAGGYAVAKAVSSRSSPDVRVVGEVTTQVPVVLSPDQAAQAAAILHAISWQEARGEVKLSVPLSFIKYVTSNCFGLALRGAVSRLRLEEMNYADGVFEYTLRYDRQSAYTSEVTGVPIPAPTPPPSTIVGEAVLAVLDISPRIDSEDGLNILYAATGGLPAWVGATVQRSLDGGANYTSVVNINRGPVMGSLVNPLPAASEFYTDRTNVVRVQLYRDTQTIESITDVQLLSEGGAFAIQRPDDSWEVLQYRDAVEVSAGVYDLSYLHRGQLNSGTSSHLAGALFVMLADAVAAPAQSSWIGADLTHRAVSYGESPETADEQTATYVGRSQLEWPVAYLHLSRASSIVSALWTPRHRLGTEDAPVASINFTGYRVTLDDGVLPAVIFDTTTPSFAYDASALGSPLTVNVSALNRITGAGPSTSGAI